MTQTATVTKVLSDGRAECRVESVEGDEPTEEHGQKETVK